jgi:hypothetical protein
MSENPVSLEPENGNTTAAHAKADRQEAGATALKQAKAFARAER